MLWLIWLFVLFSLCIYVLNRKRSDTTKPTLPPALFGKLPIIGHTLIPLTDSLKLYKLLLSVAKYINKQGGVVYATFGPITCYLITDPEDAWTVSNTCLEKSYVYSFLNNCFGQGLISGSGEYWQRHRKLLNPAFSLPVIHGFLGIFNNQVKLLIQNLEPFVGQTAFQLTPYLKNYVLTVSCLTAFGTKDIQDKHFYSKYTEALTEILEIISQRIVTLWFHNDTLNKWFGERNRENQFGAILNALSDEVIDIKKGYTKGPMADFGHKPFIDIMIEHLKNNQLTEKEVQEEINTIIAASFETSAESLEVAMLLLGSFPEVQDKVYKEIIEVCGETGDVSKEDLHKLVYTEAVIKECLRYLSVVPIYGRYIDKEVKLKNYTLRANSECLIIVHGIHHSPSWGPDVNEFKPERWLDSSSMANNSRAFFGFSVGKRMCVGKTYAMMAMKVALTHLLRAFKITADYRKVEFQYSITLHPVRGHEMYLERRQPLDINNSFDTHEALE